jgi:hypothetical protein
MGDQHNEITTKDLAGRTPPESTSGEAAVEEQQQPQPINESEQATDVATATRQREAEMDEESSTSTDAGGEQRMPLFPAEEGERFRSRWTDIQAGFVDRPREMVEQADHLVADLMQRLAAQFADERGRLEAHWETDDDVSTEDLRITLTRYRSFFERLLAA